MDDRYGASLYEIEIGIVVPPVIYAPVWLAEQRGFLRDEGLTVRLRSFGSTEGTTAALRDGIVPVTIGSPEGSILNALGGGDLRLVSGFVNRPPLSMIAQPRYRSMADLRGAKLRTTSLKEGTHLPSDGKDDGCPWHASASRLSIRHSWRPPATLGSVEGRDTGRCNSTCAFQLHCRGDPDFPIWAM